MEELNAPITRPGISAATLAKLGIRHIEEAEAFELLGQKFAGLYIPYGIHVEGKCTALAARARARSATSSSASSES